MSYADFASKFIEKQAMTDGLTFVKKHLEGNLIELEVTFKTLNVMKVVQEPEMSAYTVIGALGGQLGLFLGASALSFVELIEILLLVMITSMKTAIYRVFGRYRRAPTNI
ncbi:acid-sensing ion channel 5 [Elysia marginata]|uniref:Acid-sensing ion channel 5 n=1 Tax=Elysia marginata TaxID=1093978 RepID=A0AAV4GN43_9GAST|nr:acid-sensing ion channel 5 [Elysia marginata]